MDSLGPMAPVDGVVITGGAGFIGRALVARCLAAGHRVTVIDNLCAGRLKNIEPFLGDIDFREADILDVHRLRSIFREARPAAVFHLAAHHFIPFCDAHPSETLRVNVEGTHVVLSEAARQDVPVAVVASSGAFYPSREELLEETLQPEPADVYGLSKAMTEQVTRFVAATTPMKCIAARLFNTYGPFETNPHLIPEIIKGLQAGMQVSLGNTHTKRDYIYVDDVADLLYRCASKLAGPGDIKQFQAVNVGTGNEYSAAEVVETLGRILGKEISLHIDPKRVRSVDKLHQRADTRRLMALTGSRARHTLSAGLERLLMHEKLKVAA